MPCFLVALCKLCTRITWLYTGPPKPLHLQRLQIYASSIYPSSIEQGAVAVLPKKIKGGFSVRPPAKRLKLPGQPRRKPRQWAILDVVKIHILYDDVARRMVIHFTWLWQASDTRLEDHAPRTSSVTLFAMVNTVPAPYKNMHVVALRQFCLLLAQKPSMPAMQIQTMFGTYDPAEYQ